MIVRRTAANRKRPGAAVVELAVLLPLLATLTVGMIEMTRMVQVKQSLTNCSRNACRRAILGGSSNASVVSDLNGVLTAAKINPTDVTTTMTVNGATRDVNSAIQGDTITVQLSVPANKVNWLAGIVFSKAVISSESLAMMRQN